MKRGLFTAFFILTSLLSLAQRTLPYPIILVHGWTGSATTWGAFTNYLSNQANLSVSRYNLSFDLNCDGNIAKSNINSDVCNYTIANLGNHDIYVVDFKYGYNGLLNNPYSNEAAAVKQGRAIKLAVQEVIIATGAEKVVLLGHSMGGLAIREYLQNPSNWLSDGQHHITKVITIGTPHGGSNLGSGDLNIYSLFGDGTEASEAVRDLRTSYKTGYRGVYLYGGYENSTYIQRGIGSSYFNLDVNCNGIIGERIVGLNEKSIYTNLDFACIIGGPNITDGVVTVESQNLNNFYNINAELFYHNCGFGDFNCHTNEPKMAIFPMIYALDEPKKYPISIQYNTLYKGFFANQSNGNYIDTDTYTVYCPTKGILNISCGVSASVNAKVTVKNMSGIQIADFMVGSGVTQAIDVLESGSYTITFSGNSNNGWATYNYSASFCSLPEPLNVTALGNVSFCEGGVVKLLATNGYDKYRWYKDGIEISGATNSIMASESGGFTVQGLKCDRWTNVNNKLTVTVKPLPAKPIVIKEDQPNQFVLTSSSADTYQWVLNGNTIGAATNQNYIPQELGSYTVKVTQNDCANQSDIVVVSMEKPTLVINGKNPICDGESVVLGAPNGFGQYKWVNEQMENITDKRELTVSKGGIYRVATKRGKFVSELSDPLTLVVNPKPQKPIISIESNGLKSSSLSNNQWYADGVILKDATAQTLSNIGAGSYTVRVTELGCYTESEPFLITSIAAIPKSDSIKLYPNPNKGMFWVELPDHIKEWEVVVWDAQGKKVLEQRHSFSLLNRERITINNASGSYLIKVSSGNLVQQIKLVIE